MNLLDRWTQLMAQYREEKSLVDDVVDVVSAVLFTIGSLAIGLGIAAIVGGAHG